MDYYRERERERERYLMFMFYLFHMMSACAKLENVSQIREKNKMFYNNCYSATFLMNKLVMDGAGQGGGQGAPQAQGLSRLHNNEMKGWRG